jgi:hypothetical protein
MESGLATIVGATPDRLIGLAADGMLRLVWDTAVLRLPAYDLPHLAAVLDAWHMEEEPPGLRRGYYRLLHSPDGGVQLWLCGIGLLLSREDLRVLTALVVAAAGELCVPLCRQPHTPFGLGYRPLRVPHLGTDCQN